MRAAPAAVTWRSPSGPAREERSAEPAFELPDPALAARARRPAPEERETLLLYAWAELSYEEIATVTGVAVGTVRSRLARARARLAADLAPERSPK